MSSKPEATNVWNTVAFVTLTVQTAATVLTMRYSRLSSTSSSILNPGEPQFATTSAVALAEFGKMWVGIILLSYEILIQKSSHDPFTTFSNQLFGDLPTLLKMAVPASTYSIQNNLLFMALHHLDSSLYQITYQLKIFTAALFAICLLKRKYSKKQCISFAFLAIGASLANVSMESDHNNNNNNINDNRNQYIGIICILLATCTSGFAGVFMEMQLKGASSLLVKNIQLGMFGFLMCIINSIIMGDMTDIIIPYGFLHGFTTSTWIVVVLNIFGGYLVAFVLKRASNIIKSFAAGLAVILIVLGSYLFFETTFNSLFYVGAILVLAGNAIYQREDLQKQKKAKQPILPK